MSSYERGRSVSRSPPPPRSRTPPEEYPSRPGSGRSPRTPEDDKYKSRMSRSGSRGRSGSPRRSRSGEGRRTPPGSSPRMRSRSPRDRSRSYERSRPRYYDGSPPPRRGGGGGREREAPEPNKCLGIFGLSLYTTERELEKHFGQFGRIDKCQVVLDGHSGRSRGFAFIYYETVDDAAEARKEMDGKELDGKPIRVDFSITKRPHTPTPGMYMGRPSRDFRRGGRGGGGGYRGGRGGGYRDSRPSYGDRYGGGDRYRDDRRDRDRYYEDRDRGDRYYDDRDRYERRDDRDRYHDRRGGPSHGGYPEDRRYDSYPPAPSSGYGKRPRPRSPSPYERDSRPRREYRSRSREYERRY